MDKAYIQELELQNAELRMMNERLCDEKNIYVDMFNVCPLAYFIFSPNGKIIATNRLFSSMLSHVSGGLLYKNLLDFISTPSMNTWESFLQEINEDIKNVHDVYIDFCTPEKTIKTKLCCNYYFVKDACYIRAVVVCISEEANELEQIRLDRNKYRALASMSKEIIFEYDVNVNTLILSECENGEIDTSNVILDAMNYFVANQKIYEKDLKSFLEFVNRMENGTQFEKIQIRYKIKESEYIWIKIRAKSLFDNEGKLIKIIGKIRNIDDETKEYLKLREKATKDPLTRLISKQATKDMVQEVLNDNNKPASSHAFIIVDVDNFKNVNDTLGHLTGDIVLNKVAAVLKTTFRSTDIVGRIGGDEFVVFMQNVQKVSIIAEKGDILCKKIKGLVDDKGVSYNVSCSIGISIFPRDGHTYDEVFKRADAALYYIKNNGKNGYLIYNENMVGIKRTLPKTLVDNFVVTQVVDKYDANILDQIDSFTYETLYNTQDFNMAVTIVLGNICKYFDLSRASVISINRNGTDVKVLNEWCKKGVKSQKNILKKAIFNYSSAYIKNARGKILYQCIDCNKLNVPPIVKDEYKLLDAKSILQCTIISNQDTNIYLSFEMCETKHQWTNLESDVCVSFSHILEKYY